jgi:uncharacterized protein
MKKNFWENGLNFTCAQCGNCCTFEGGAIYGTESEFKAIAKLVNLSFKDFIKKYTKNEDGFVSLKLKENDHCIFYNKGCSIYEKRPGQCKSYPFWPEIVKNEFRWINEGENCKGISNGKKWSKDEIIAELEQAGDQLLKKDKLDT